MEKLSLYIFTFLFISISQLFSQETPEPHITIITSSSLLLPSSLDSKQERYPDFLTIYIKDQNTDHHFITATLHINQLQDRSPLLLKHQDLNETLNFHLVNNQGQKILTNNSPIQLSRQDDGTFSAKLDLIIDPQNKLKLLSGDYLCNFHITYNKER